MEVPQAQFFVVQVPVIVRVSSLDSGVLRVQFITVVDVPVIMYWRLRSQDL